MSGYIIIAGQKKEEIMKKIRMTGNIFRWLCGLFFLVGGIGITQDSVAAGIFCALFGLFLLPPVWRILARKARYPRWMAAVVPAVLFALTVFFMPETEAQSPNPQTVKEAVPESAEEAASVQEEILPEEPIQKNTATEKAAQAIVETVSETGEMKVHFLDVGQGLAILVQSDGQNLMYDGGDRETSSFVVSYLKGHGVTTIDYLISSHYDSDHVAGLIGCLNAFEVRNVINSDYVHDSQTYESFVDAVQKKGLTMQHPAVGTEFSFGTGSFTILAPAVIDPEDSNDNSVAIRLMNGSNSFLFTGDAESKSEEQMCSSGIDLSCDVLVPGHHGSATATSWELLQAAVPEYAVISCGSGNSYGHPHKDTMDKLQAMEVQVYRTDLQGTVVAVSDGTDIQWDQEPCNDYTPGDSSDTGTQPERSSAAAEENSQPEAQTPAEPTEDKAAETGTAAVQQTQEPTVTETPVQESAAVTETPAAEEKVWVSETGEKYHNKPDCGRMNPDKARQMTRSEAEALGLEPCKKCF